MHNPRLLLLSNCMPSLSAVRNVSALDCAGSEELRRWRRISHLHHPVQCELTLPMLLE